jgi:hypothetical protein
MQRPNLPINFHRISQSLLQDPCHNFKYVVVYEGMATWKVDEKTKQPFLAIDSFYADTCMDAMNECC